ncbi:MAG: protein-arginine deiminase family protein [Lentisphaeria bacterium]|nr:protein-arginine deiminase family protein [Lentisphaeria bacterium]
MRVTKTILYPSAAALTLLGMFRATGEISKTVSVPTGKYEVFDVSNGDDLSLKIVPEDDNKGNPRQLGNSEIALQADDGLWQLRTQTPSEHNYKATVLRTDKIWMTIEGNFVKPDGGGGGGGGGGVVKTDFMVRVPGIDIDIDSDNNDGFGQPSGDPQFEDAIENDANQPGKIICVNDDDSDNDGIPGYADGFSRYTGDNYKSSSDSFAVVVITLSPNVDVNKAKIEFVYSGVAPDQVTLDAATNSWNIAGDGHLRLWKKNGTVDRDKNSDYVAPGTSITASALGFANTIDGRTKTFYLEGVRAASGQTITAILYPQGDDDDPIDDIVKVTVVRVDLDIDTNRDGTITEEDDGKESTWTLAEGALVSSQSILPSPIVIPGTAEMIVRAIGIPAVSGFSLRLLDLSNDPIRSWCMDANSNILSNQYLPSGQSLGWVASDTVFHPIYSCEHKPPPENGTNLLKYRLELVDQTGTVCGTDTIVAKVAPIILPAECNPATSVYTTGSLPNNGAYLASKVGGIYVSSGDDQWACDKAKFTSYGLEEGTWQTLVVDLNHSGKGTFINALRADYHTPSILWDVGGDGGAIMATAPTAGIPFGKILLGTKHSITRSHWDSQGLQPVVPIDTDWLCVGHVDEAIMPVGATAYLVASPWKAANMIHALIAAGQESEQIWYGCDQTAAGTDARKSTIRDIAIAKKADGTFKKTTFPSAISIDPDPVTVNFPQGHPFEYLDIARVDNEFMQVTGIDGNDVIFIRAQRGTAKMAHSQGATIYAMTDLLLENLNTVETSPASRIAKVRSQLSGAVTATFIEMPVLFAYKSGDISGYFAATSNVVNCLYNFNGQTYYPDTGNTTFNSYTANAIPGSATPVDVWAGYHCLRGEIHCGAAAKRSTGITQNWWQLAPADWK